MHLHLHAALLTSPSPTPCLLGVPAGTPPLVIKSSGKIADLEAQAKRQLGDLQV